MPEIIYIGLTNEARKFLKSLSKIDGDTHQMHDRKLELEAAKGTVDGLRVVAREQVQLNHNTGKQVFVFNNLLVHNGNRMFESFNWVENPLLDKLYDSQTGQFNLEKL